MSSFAKARRIEKRRENDKNEWKQNETNANITKKIESNDSTDDDETLWINSVNIFSLR